MISKQQCPNCNWQQTTGDTVDCCPVCKYQLAAPPSGITAALQRLSVKPVQSLEPTRAELIARGGCCKTGCINCPWGFAGF